MATRKPTVNKTLIQKILRESAIDPRQGGPLKLVIDHNMDDPGYLEKKAIELIHEARLPDVTNEIYVERSQKAIFLLAAARAIRELKTKV